MSFSKIYIPKELNPNGIEDIDMDRLNQIVVLVGRNGSGKTRILEKINYFSNIYQFADEDVTRLYKERIYNFGQTFERTKKQAEEMKLAFPETYPSRQKELIRIEKDIVINEKELQALQNSSGKNLFRRHAINFIPKNTSMRDPVSLRMSELQPSSIRFNLDNLNQISSYTLPIIQSVQNRYYEAIREDYENIQEKEIAISEYENLKYWIKEFLNVDLKRDNYGNASFFGFNIGGAKLSGGQSILLQLCLLLYKEGKNLNNNIILIDEPENHTHPSAIIEALKKIIEYTREGQVWIATHSIPIIAYLASLQETSIHYVEEGKVTYAGSAPEKVLKGLLGDEEQIAKLQDFIGLPAQFAINQFAYQCLFEPQVMLTGTNDPQTNQIKEILNQLVGNEKLKLLDFGAGKGRLLANIIETDKSLLDKIDYVAFDEYESNKEGCCGIIAGGYGNADNRYYNKIENLKSDYPSHFDVVLMCNVLHEIDPRNWLILFNDKISPLLSENGFLLIVEDSQIPIGEKAYQNGFIVLDEAQLKYLFNITAKDEGFITQAFKTKERLKAHLIPKKFLTNISATTRTKALESLNKQAADEIAKLRGGPTDYKTGHKHAFWVQQFANTQLALNEG